MQKIRFGKDIPIRWRITTNGEQRPLEGRDLQLILTNKFGDKKILPFVVDDTNVVVAVWFGKDHDRYGAHHLTLFENLGHVGQTAVDSVDFVNLVEYTTQESRHNRDNLELNPINLEGDICTNGRAANNYELWLLDGHEGTLSDYLEWSKGPEGKPGKDGKSLTFDDLTEEQKAALRGKQGEPGKDGLDAKINGVNTLNIVQGRNMQIRQSGSTMTFDSIPDKGSIPLAALGSDVLNQFSLTYSKVTGALGYTPASREQVAAMRVIRVDKGMTLEELSNHFKTFSLIHISELGTLINDGTGNFLVGYEGSWRVGYTGDYDPDPSSTTFEDLFYRLVDTSNDVATVGNVPDIDEFNALVNTVNDGKSSVTDLGTFDLVGGDYINGLAPMLIGSKVGDSFIAVDNEDHFLHMATVAYSKGNRVVFFYETDEEFRLYLVDFDGDKGTYRQDGVIGSGGSSVTVVDNLESDSATDALSAKQGKVLNESVVHKTGDETIEGKKVFTEDAVFDGNMTKFGGDVVTDADFYQRDVDGKGAFEQLTALSSKIGDLSNLETEAKDNLVDAINEAAQSGSSINVVDNLTSDSATDALSARQGKALSEELDELQDAPLLGERVGTKEEIDALVVDSELSSDSTNPVMNRVVTKEIAELKEKSGSMVIERDIEFAPLLEWGTISGMGSGQPSSWSYKSSNVRKRLPQDAPLRVYRGDHLCLDNEISGAEIYACIVHENGITRYAWVYPDITIAEDGDLYLMLHNTTETASRATEIADNLRILNSLNLAENNSRIGAIEEYLFPTQGSAYYGEKIQLERHLYQHSSFATLVGNQSIALYGRELFLFRDGLTMDVYNVDTKAKVGSGTLDAPETAPHCNCAFFGAETDRYDESDAYPIVYVNAYNNSPLPKGTLYGYRVALSEGVFSLNLVKTIRVGFTDDPMWFDGSGRTYGNFFYNANNGRLYAYTLRENSKKVRFFSFNFPSADKVLSTSDVIDYFDTDYIDVIQDNVYHEGKVYIVYGNQPPKVGIVVVDLLKKAIVSHIPLGENGMRYEPEAIEILDEKILYSFSTQFKLISV